MPKIPNDMSEAAIKKRAIVSAANRAEAKAKAAEPPPPPKIRIAKGR
jgi:hypothetical protein